MEKKRVGILWGLAIILVVLGILLCCYFQSHTLEDVTSGFSAFLSITERGEDELPADDVSSPIVNGGKQEAASQGIDDAVTEEVTEVQPTEKPGQPEGPSVTENGLHPNELPLDIIE